MLVSSNPRQASGLGATLQMDRRKRYLTGLLSRGRLGSYDPRTRYLSGPKRRGLFGLGQDDSDGFSVFDPFSTVDSSFNVTTAGNTPSIIDPTQGIVTTGAGTFNVPYTNPAGPTLGVPISAIPGSTAAANAQVLSDVPPGYAINSQGNLVNASTGQVVNPAVQAAQTAAAVGQAATYITAAGKIASVPAGYTVNSAGQLVQSGIGSSLSTFLASSSLIAGTPNSTVLLWGAIGFAAFSLMSKKKRR